MGFVFECFFIYAGIDACENFPYVDAFETAIFLFLVFFWEWDQTVRDMALFILNKKNKNN